jgi:hypothetical protein
MVQIHEDVKRSDDFYKRFIRQLNEEVAAIRDENYSSGKVTVSKNFYRWVKNKANSLLSRKQKEKLKAVFEGRKASKTIAGYKDLILNWETKESPIDLALAQKNIDQYSQGQLSLITTALLVHSIVNEN